MHTVWFLFQGEAPLTISVFGSQQAAVNVPVEFVRPRQFDRRVKQWWQAFNRVVDEQIKSGDYPPILHAYLKNLIGKRFRFCCRVINDPKKPDPLLQTFQLMFDVESLRIDTINDLMTRGVQVQACRPTAAYSQLTGRQSRVDNLPDSIEIEPMARVRSRRVFLSSFWHLGIINFGSND